MTASQWSTLLLTVYGLLLIGGVALRVWENVHIQRHGTSPLSPDTRRRLFEVSPYLLWSGRGALLGTALFGSAFVLMGHFDTALTVTFAGSTLALLFIGLGRLARILSRHSGGGLEGALADLMGDVNRVRGRRQP